MVPPTANNSGTGNSRRLLREMPVSACLVDNPTYRPKDGQTDTHTQTDGQTRQTDRQTGAEGKIMPSTDQQMDRHIHTHKQID